MVEANNQSSEDDEFFDALENPQTQQDMSVRSRMARSKYGMLEILRAAFNRIDAVLTMRLLNKKFLALSQDPYLDNFQSSQDTMFLEVRKEEDIDYFRKMITYTNMIKGNCLHIEFFWNF